MSPKTKAIDKDKLKALHEKQDKEDRTYIKESTCPWRKTKCEYIPVILEIHGAKPEEEPRQEPPKKVPVHQSTLFNWED
jgi:hypothetical protein